MYRSLQKHRSAVWHPAYAGTDPLNRPSSPTRCALGKIPFPACSLRLCVSAARAPINHLLRGGRAVAQEVERHAVDDEQDRERQRQARMPRRHQASDRDREDDDLEEHPGG